MTISVTKKSVGNIELGGIETGYNITLNLTCTDGTGTLIDKDFSQLYNKKDDASIVEDAFIQQMQKEIDDYKSNKAVLDSQQMDTSVSNIQSSLTE